MLNKIKKAYYYFFYIIWGMYEGSPNRWASDVKAGAFILFLECLVVFACIGYYSVIFSLKNLFDVAWLYGPLAVFTLLHYFAFYKNDVWRERVYEFGEWPNRKNVIGAAIVVFVIALIIANFLTTLILLSNN
jgi:hypothetical protein